MTRRTCSSHTCRHAEPCDLFLSQAVRVAVRAGAPVGVVPCHYGWAIVPTIPDNGYEVAASGRVVGHLRRHTNAGPTVDTWTVRDV